MAASPLERAMTAWEWVVAHAVVVLSWTWLVYPALVFILSRAVQPPRRVTPERWPSVTAVLATRDDVATVIARVEDFLTADYPAHLLQVVVGVDGATEDSLSRIRSQIFIPKVVVVAADSGGGKAMGLNAAIREATGEVLVFSDSQQRFAPDAIRLMVSRLLGDSRLAVVGGALQLPGDREEGGRRSPIEWYWRIERELRSAEAKVHSSVGVSGSIYSMWRSLWAPMPQHLILDDVWLPMRLVLAGRRVGYELDAKAWDSRSTSASEEKVRKVRTLTGNFQLVAWLPALILPFRNPIWLQFVSHKLLRLTTPWMILLLLVGGVGVTSKRVPASMLPTLLSVLAVAISLVVITPKLRAALRRGVQWGWSLQAAVVRATYNGLLGRWDVWQ
jgi:cellulose synthase/poly-beta-1,6-N-acetylglucosamine synthase-like glycosyltransferase